MFRQGVERNINAAPLEIARHVLPEIGKLQRSTRVVGELLPLGVAITAQVKHQAAHRVGRIAAIAEHVRPSRIDRKSTRLNSSHLGISYAVFCLKKKTKV